MVIKDKQTADDIFQDTFIKVIFTLKSGTYKEEGKFIQWVMRIAHNLVIDFFRKAKRIPVVDSQNDEYNILDNLWVYDESYEDKIITEQIHQDIRNMIEYLPVNSEKFLL
jgi:RNA polymerase sigma factor (sigma-70 family)